MAIIDQYSKEELIQISQQSKNFAEFIRKLGYKSDSTKTRNTIKKRIEDFNIDISHFSSNNTNKIIRTPENVFVKNSTAVQSVLRKFYKNGEYTLYQCAICNQEPIWQGKELTLILDHINGINNDDRLENLRWVCPNCNQQLATTGSKNLNRKNIAKKYYCIDCGKEISPNATRCIECFSKYNTIALEDMRVTREELKDLIFNKSFSEIGRQYGVSDNAVRKWCDKFGLPRTKTEIKKYSVEEWSKI